MVDLFYAKYQKFTNEFNGKLVQKIIAHTTAYVIAVFALQADECVPNVVPNVPVDLLFHHLTDSSFGKLP